MQKLITAQLLFLLLGGIYAGDVNFTDCGSRANITELTVTGCTTQPCIFYRGNTYDVRITAIGTYETFTLPYKVTAKIYLVPVTLLKGNACTELAQGSCPVESGKEFIYENKINVLNKFPSMKTKVKALVVDDKGNTVICVGLSVKVK